MEKVKIIDNKYVYFGSYPQDGTVKEPIKWVIIKREDNIITLITERILINFMYDRYYSEYKNSAVRKFILEEFVPVAFSKEELDLILPTQLEDVVDKVFLPLVDDLKDIPREERIKKVTPYAISNKASHYPVFYKSQMYLKDNGWYWTRTPFKPPYNPKNDREVYYVEYNGSFTGRVTTGPDIGIVPIIRLKVEE